MSKLYLQNMNINTYIPNNYTPDFTNCNGDCPSPININLNNSSIEHINIESEEGCHVSIDASSTTLTTLSNNCRTRYISRNRSYYEYSTIDATYSNISNNLDGDVVACEKCTLGSYQSRNYWQNSNNGGKRSALRNTNARDIKGPLYLNQSTISNSNSASIYPSSFSAIKGGTVRIQQYSAGRFTGIDLRGTTLESYSYNPETWDELNICPDGAYGDCTHHRNP